MRTSKASFFEWPKLCGLILSVALLGNPRPEVLKKYLLNGGCTGFLVVAADFPHIDEHIPRAISQMYAYGKYLEQVTSTVSFVAFEMIFHSDSRLSVARSATEGNGSSSS